MGQVGTTEGKPHCTFQGSAVTSSRPMASSATAAAPITTLLTPLFSRMQETRAAPSTCARCIGTALPSLIGRLDVPRANQAAGQ